MSAVGLTDWKNARPYGGVTGQIRDLFWRSVVVLIINGVKQSNLPTPENNILVERSTGAVIQLYAFCSHDSC